MSGLLAGKVIMATGAASGIGRAACLIFAREGASVVVTDVNADGGYETVESIRKTGAAAEFFATDVSNRTQADEAVAFAVQAFGRLDGAFNNAAAPEHFTNFLDATDETFDRLMSINVRGVWSCMRAQVAQMRRQGDGGAIVNTASTAGLRGARLMALYAASKHAVVGLSKSVALEFAATGPRINVLCPGVTDTEMLRRVTVDDRMRTAYLAAQPSGRFGEPSEIGEATAWLLSDSASYVTGACMPVDGGLAS